MSTTNDEYETFVLKVHMNCQGCRNRVRKVLRKIEGVYKVDIDAEDQKAIVTGNVNPSTLVKKMAKLGKHAEILIADYNQEQANHGRGQTNDQVHYTVNDHPAFENQYVIPPFFGKDHWGPEGYFYQDVESEMNQRFTAPLFFENAYNRANPNFISFSENPMMRPVSLRERGASDYFGLENQEWPQNLIGGSSISEYGHHEPSLMADMHGYYNHLPYGINIHIQEPPTRNDLMMNTNMLQHMTNQKYF